MLSILEEKSTDIGSVLNGSFNMSALIDSIKGEFFSKLGTDICESAPTDEETALAGQTQRKIPYERMGFE